jgi:hypothetical protein
MTYEVTLYNRPLFLTFDKMERELVKLDHVELVVKVDIELKHGVVGM